MKRIIGFLLIFSILVCSLSAGFVFSAAYDIEEEEGNIEFSLNFDNEVVNEEDILNVTVKIKSSYESFLLSGIQFDLKYEYNGPARSAIPLSFELIKGDMVYDERFSKEMQIGTKYEGSYFVTTFMSEPEAEFDEDELSITFPFRVKETIYEGQYSFKLEVEDMYYTDLEAPDDMFPSLNFTVEGEDYAGWSGYPIWLGQEQMIILSGDNTEGTPIFIDKEIQSSDKVYIADESVAVFDESRYESGIENVDEYAFIYVKGIRIDTTEMYIISECVEFKTDEGEDPDSTEDDTLVPYFYTTITAVKIKVTKPDIWFPNIASQPDKTDYFVGEKIDLTGLQFVLGYNNNDVKIVSSGFKVKEYDFSTPGEKEVEVS
ncbi:MAG: bacterial Ig-like domain-containing protein, partial [Acutalibacteraceae bacterium]|nr:bacterial Ig-like domain-containing protein [Acutalibacteraceae bacterium]